MMTGKKNWVRMLGAVTVLMLALAVLFLVLNGRGTETSNLRDAVLLEKHVLDLQPSTQEQGVSWHMRQTLAASERAKPDEAVQAGEHVALKAIKKSPSVTVNQPVAHRATIAQPVIARPAKRATIKQASHVSRYIIKVGSYRVLAHAKNMQRRLSQVGIRSRIQSAVVHQKKWYRTLAGPFSSYRQALMAQRSIQQKWSVRGKLQKLVS